MKNHIQAKHTEGGSDKCTCQHCGWQCVEKKRMQYHLFKKHNDTSMGELKLFKCKYCVYTDIERYAIRQHEKNVHEISMGKILCYTRGHFQEHKRWEFDESTCNY